MSKCILEYNMPDDKSDFMYAIKGADAHFVLHALAQEFRQVYKYSDVELKVEFAEYWSRRLFELAADYDVNIWEDY